jgi:hypothetical protein
MRKISVVLLITLLAASSFTLVMAQTLPQTSTDANASPTPPPIIVRWMRYQGAITQWNGEDYKGSITVNAKTANFPAPNFRPRVTVDAFWSNEPPFPSSKPTGGQFTFTHYNAKLVQLQSIRKQSDLIVNITGIWNINKVKITTEFNQNGDPINTVKEITSIATQAKGQLGITSDWKQFKLTIGEDNTLQGIEISMRTTTNMMNPFSSGIGPTATKSDLMLVLGSFRSLPGLPNYNPDLDCNKDSKIDLADLTTVAANM